MSGLPERPRAKAFPGVTLAGNCCSAAEVDTVLDFAISQALRCKNQRI
jgi:hypothetical protein